MLSINFIGQNIHFAIGLFCALVFFAAFWLYFDAWLNKRHTKEIFEWAGFLVVSISFVIYATVTEQSVLGSSSIGNTLQITSIVLRIIGFISIITGQLVVPLQKKPELNGLDEKLFTVSNSKNSAAKHNQTRQKDVAVSSSAVGFSNWINLSNLLLPFGALTIAVLYFRRATKGLERHLKPVALGFVFISCFELLALASLWQNTTNPSISKLVASFGWLWFVDQALLLTGAIILGRWVWQYLTERFISQLFMIFTTVTLTIFLVTAVSFTFLLVNNVQKSTLDNLETSSSVLNYAINGKKAESLSGTEAIAENQSVATAIASKDHDALVNLSSTFLANKKLSSLIIVNDSGQVLLRAEDPASWGDSISSDTLLQRAVLGQSTTSVTSKDGVLVPVIYIRSAVPIYNAQKQIVGVAIGSLKIDNAFVDGIKRSTGLDSSVYAGNTLSATTFLAASGQTRSIGIVEKNPAVQNTVIKNGQNYKGSGFILNKEYSVVYAPLKDADNTTIGMLFIGQPKNEILKTASHSIELTFIITAILLILSIIPAYLIARNIAKQVG